MRNELRMKENFFGYLLLLPLLAVLGYLIIYPILLGVSFSLYEKIIGQAERFVGLQNYAITIKDKYFLGALLHSLIFTGGAIGGKFILGLAVALMLNQSFRGRNVTRGILMLPWIIPTFVSCLTWLWMYDTTQGIFNWILLKSGIVKTPIEWVSNTQLALFSVIIVNIWKGMPFFVVTILAGLQAVPEQLYEAANIDGAGGFRRLVHITLPLLLPVIIIVTGLSFIWTFNDFQMVWILTHGGPARATEILPTLTYRMAFQYMNLGQAATIPLFVLPFIGIFAFFLIKVTRKKEIQ